MTFASPPPTVPPADAWHNCAPVAFIDTPERRGVALPRRLHFDRGVRPEIIAVMSMMLREPVRNSPPNLAEEIAVALISQLSEISDQVCDGVLFNGAAAPLKNRERLGGRCNVFGFIDDAPLDYTTAYTSPH
jgi:hypothetical protein